MTKKIALASALLSLTIVNAREKTGGVFKSANAQKVMAGCSAPQNSAELAVNNVRTIIFSGSDMWWDLFGSGSAYYVIPKVDDKSKWISSNFTGNVWFGGIDNGGQLRVAAQTYRQDGIDFWTGPLNMVDGTTTPDICSQYDRVYRVTRQEVEDFKLTTHIVTDNIRNWPGTGDITKNLDPYLAPYIDADASGDYSPDGGDYPAYDIQGLTTSALTSGKDNQGLCKARIFGDETLWWVYNDNGGIHGHTQGLALGMEIRGQAFGFKTTDEVNNMTFYNYQLINRSSHTLNQTYLSVVTDADLGYYLDDYVGCDVKRGLGYLYNGDNYDESVSGTNGYGDYIPAIGVDFFLGPFADPGDGIDNDKDGCVDCTFSVTPTSTVSIPESVLPEKIIMSQFLYYNNNFPGTPQQTQDPSNASQTYGYMTGHWRDGTPYTCGGNAYGGSIPTNYVFPDDTDPSGPCGTNWTEITAGNQPNDRRIIQSAGAFTLKPGAVNYVTFGLPWARTTQKNNAASSIPLLKAADDKAQALFDNCFKLLDGPEAPDLTIQEMNNELILFLTNKPGSNNYLNNYIEKDVTILPISACPTATSSSYTNPDPYYRFEGIKIFQLKNDAVTQEDLSNPDKAKLAFECDLKNGVTKLVNYQLDQSIGGDVPVVKVEGQDNGIQSSFHFTKDLFSNSADQLVINNKTYYFLVVAYAYNNYLTYKEDVTCTQDPNANIYGQKKPYLEGRKSKKAYGIPHIPSTEKGGTVVNSYYGYGPKITRVEGQGNGGNILDLTQQSIDDIFNSNDRVAKITYDNGKGPVNIKVVDPLNVPNATFALQFLHYPLPPASPSSTFTPVQPTQIPSLTDAFYGKTLSDSISWTLTNKANNAVYYPKKSIKLKEEFYFSEIGLSVSLAQVFDAGSHGERGDTLRSYQDGDFLDASLTFSDPTKPWLSGVPDADGSNYAGVNDNGFNWIRSGSFTDGTTNTQDDINWAKNTKGAKFADPNSIFEKVLGGTWAPYILTAHSYSNSATNTVEGPAGPAAEGFASSKMFSGGTLGLNGLDTRDLASVDVIFTADKSKWTHCMVLEECDDQLLSQNHARKLEIRRHRSVDKSGIALGSPGCNPAEAQLDTFNYGMGWFPGYAINVETGERLNMAFGEDSFQSPTGQDMVWNPTSVVTLGGNYPFMFGGRHYVYVFGNNKKIKYNGAFPTQISAVYGKNAGAGTYKDVADMVNVYKASYNPSGPVQMQIVYKNLMSDAMWVNIPVVSESKYEFGNPANMPCDAKVRLRVKRAYRYGYATNFTPANGTLNMRSYPSTGINAGTGAVDPSNTSEFPSDIASPAVNNNFPLYTFSTADIYTDVSSADAAKNALDYINVVPNPYYGYSTYEQNRIDNRIRITNLPDKCKIRIYTLNGTLVRTYNRDVTGQEDQTVRETSEFVHTKHQSFQDWDLKNQSGIPIASGLYIIHIDAPGIGEKILKWFGVMRPLDLQNY